jgi:hypothetical protein
MPKMLRLRREVPPDVVPCAKFLSCPTHAVSLKISVLVLARVAEASRQGRKKPRDSDIPRLLVRSTKEHRCKLRS